MKRKTKTKPAPPVAHPPVMPLDQVKGLGMYIMWSAEAFSPINNQHARNHAVLKAGLVWQLLDPATRHAVKRVGLLERCKAAGCTPLPDAPLPLGPRPQK
jgi:hypothetical protein